MCTNTFHPFTWRLAALPSFLLVCWCVPISVSYTRTPPRALRQSCTSSLLHRQHYVAPGVRTTTKPTPPSRLCRGCRRSPSLESIPADILTHWRSMPRSRGPDDLNLLYLLPYKRLYTSRPDHPDPQNPMQTSEGCDGYQGGWSSAKEVVAEWERERERVDRGNKMWCSQWKKRSKFGDEKRFHEDLVYSSFFHPSRFFHHRPVLELSRSCLTRHFRGCSQ